MKKCGKYQKKFSSDDCPNGIPKEEFESLIMEYIPVTAEQIQTYAVFDKEKQVNAWSRLGCLNYSPTFFETSLPEVTKIKENDDGSFKYLGNKILNDGIKDIPEYQYRFNKG